MTNTATSRTSGMTSDLIGHGITKGVDRAIALIFGDDQRRLETNHARLVECVSGDHIALRHPANDMSAEIFVMELDANKQAHPADIRDYGLINGLQLTQTVHREHPFVSRARITFRPG